MFFIRKTLSGMCLGHLKEENRDQDEIHWHDDSLEVHYSLRCVSLCLSVPKKKKRKKKKVDYTYALLFSKH